MPGINDDPRRSSGSSSCATEAGARSIGGQTLFLRGAVRDIFMDWLRSNRPDLVPRYEQLYARGAYMPGARAARDRARLRARRCAAAVARGALPRTVPARGPPGDRRRPRTAGGGAPGEAVLRSAAALATSDDAHSVGVTRAHDKVRETAGRGQC